MVNKTNLWKYFFKLHVWKLESMDKIYCWWTCLQQANNCFWSSLTPNTHNELFSFSLGEILLVVSPITISTRTPFCYLWETWNSKVYYVFFSTIPSIWWLALKHSHEFVPKVLKEGASRMSWLMSLIVEVPWMHMLIYLQILWHVSSITYNAKTIVIL